MRRPLPDTGTDSASILQAAGAIRPLSRGHNARGYPEDFLGKLLACADLAMLRGAARALGFDEGGLSDEEIAALYMAEPALALADPNPFFDEKWYRLANPDVQGAIETGHIYSGFTHFLMFGLLEGRWPNAALMSVVSSRPQPLPPLATIDEGAYCKAHAGVREFLHHFPIVTPLQHYNLFGRSLGFAASAPGENAALSPFERIAAEFDPDYYRKRYLGGDKAEPAHDPFDHYLIYGIKNAHSPNASFDEAWYRSFYGEVREAIERGEILSGFYHFVASGRAEGRLPAFDRKQALEARLPGVTWPALALRIPQIDGRLDKRAMAIDPAAPRRLWFLLPTMNPDITFGGYRSALELILASRKAGYDVGIICTEDSHADREYFLWREKSEKFRNLVRSIPVLGTKAGTTLVVGARDVFVVYSVWDLYFADDVRKLAPDTQVVLLTQEFEPIFHDHNSLRAIMEEAYRIPHFPLINSHMLCKYLQHHRIGVFGRDDGAAAVEGRDYAVFEHRINVLASQTAASIKERRERVLIAYARPEAHAARNMFEILVLALRRVCAEGLFGPEWSFVGLGALTDMEPVPLGPGQSLVMRPKMSEEEYIRYVSAMDIGVSLMYAPHPSVVPFEFATTGALVVTNTYENRSAADLSAISGNIVAGRPSMEGMVDALRRARALVDDAARRVANIYRPANTDWGEIFNETLLRTVFGSVEHAARER